MPRKTSDSRIGTGRSPGSASTQFKPGNPGRRKGKKADSVPSIETAPSFQLLTDMRRVYQYGPNRDRTPGHKALRSLFQDNPKDFLSQLSRLERAQLASESKKRAGEAAKKHAVIESENEEAGHARAVAVLERLIEEWEKQEQMGER